MFWKITWWISTIVFFKEFIIPKFMIDWYSLYDKNSDQFILTFNWDFATVYLVPWITFVIFVAGLLIRKKNINENHQ